MTPTDPRMESAAKTNQSGGRGWDFAYVPEASFQERLFVEVFRPRSLIILCVLAAVVAAWRV